MVTCSAADLSTALAGVASQRGLLAQGPQATATATATAAAGAAPASAQATASAAVSSVAAPGSRSSSGPKGAGSGGCGLACEWCGLGGLSVTDYWTHVPLWVALLPALPLWGCGCTLAGLRGTWRSAGPMRLLWRVCGFCAHAFLCTTRYAGRLIPPFPSPAPAPAHTPVIPSLPLRSYHTYTPNRPGRCQVRG